MGMGMRGGMGGRGGGPHDEYGELEDEDDDPWEDDNGTAPYRDRHSKGEY
jgi:hypothetical protein